MTAIILTARSMACACCGAPVHRDALVLNVLTGRVARGGRSIHLEPVEMRFLCALLAAAPRLLTRKVALEALWGDQAGGGPASADQALRLYKHKLARKLAGLGLEFQVHHSGWSVEVLPLPASSPAEQLALAPALQAAG